MDNTLSGNIQLRRT